MILQTTANRVLQKLRVKATMKLQNNLSILEQQSPTAMPGTLIRQSVGSCTQPEPSC
jgi:hypothetical protein